MICPLCGREHDGKYNIKIQQVNADGSKTNFVDSRICYRCTDHLVGQFANFTNSTELGKNAELRAEIEICQWELEIVNEGDVYHTSCGNAQIFICCNVEENNYKYCPYCGKPIKQIEPKSLFCTFDE